MTLRKLLFSSLISAIVIPILLSTAIFAVLMTGFLTEKIEKSELPTALREVKNALELDLYSSIGPSRALAQSAFLKDWLNKGEPSEGIDVLKDHLATIKEQNNSITAFVVSNATNHYYTPVGINRTINSVDEPWFDNFIRSGAEYEISIDVDKKLNVATAFINYAIEVNGDRVGLGGIGKTMETMTQLISQYKIGQNGFVFLVDENDIVQLHPDDTQRGQQVDVEGLVGNIADVEINNTAYVALAIKLESINWYLVTYVPKNELYEAIDKAVLINIAIGTIIAILGVFGVSVLSNIIFKPIERITQSVSDLTQKDGDLTARLNITDNNEIGFLAVKIDIFLEQLHEMFKQVSQSGDKVKHITERVHEQISLSHQRSKTQTSSTESVAAAVEEMDVTVREISNSAQNASEVACQAETIVNSSMSTLNQTAECMEQLKDVMNSSVTSVTELSDQISSITNVLEIIQGISEQTNLLALNAAIEAARAGEQGRGFAVVADEVRNLAKRTSDSTDEINKMIASLNETASRTVETIKNGSTTSENTAIYLMDCVKSLQKVTDGIDTLTEMNTLVATSTREQSHATGEISENVSVIFNTANETSTSMEASYKLVNAMDEEAKTLDQTINRFTL